MSELQSQYHAQQSFNKTCTCAYYTSITVWGLSGSTVLFHITSHTAEKHVFWFDLQLLSETFLNIKRIQLDTITNVQWPLFLSEFNETRISSTEFRKIIKFHKNPFNGSRVPCGRTDVKLIVVFRNSANAPKNMLVCNRGKSAEFKITRWQPWKPFFSFSLHSDN